MKHAGDLFTALKDGDLVAANTYLHRFGTVTNTIDTMDFKGARRTRTIAYYTRQFVVEMLNGVVLAVSVDGERYMPSIEPIKTE